MSNVNKINTCAAAPWENLDCAVCANCGQKTVIVSERCPTCDRPFPKSSSAGQSQVGGSRVLRALAKGDSKAVEEALRAAEWVEPEATQAKSATDVAIAIVRANAGTYSASAS